MIIDLVDVVATFGDNRRFHARERARVVEPVGFDGCSVFLPREELESLEYVTRSKEGGDSVHAGFILEAEVGFQVVINLIYPGLNLVQNFLTGFYAVFLNLVQNIN